MNEYPKPLRIDDNRKWCYVNNVWKDSAILTHCSLEQAIQSVDQLFGKGYAKAHPDAVMKMADTISRGYLEMEHTRQQTNAIDSISDIGHATIKAGNDVCIGLEGVSGAIERVADAIAEAGE